TGARRKPRTPPELRAAPDPRTGRRERLSVDRGEEVKRATTLVLFLATACVAGAQQSSSIDPQKLEQIRKMSPEERAKLKARLEEIKKLSPAERERLNDNLNKIKAMPAEEVKKATERAAKLNEKEHKEFVEMASDFFKWERRHGMNA